MKKTVHNVNMSNARDAAVKATSYSTSNAITNQSASASAARDYRASSTMGDYRAGSTYSRAGTGHMRFALTFKSVQDDM